MKIKSITIVGITGGIGNALYELLKNSSIKIHGCYFSNENLAKDLLVDKNVTLQKIDLALENSIDDIKLPNNEALFFLAGIPHFSDSILEFNSNELSKQININLYSLLVCIKQAMTHDKPVLRKIVIISSVENKRLNSIYHLFKFLQEEMLKKLEGLFLEKNVSVSIIRTNWVNTNMYEQYIAMSHRKKLKTKSNEFDIVQPKDIAELCLRELSKEGAFSELDTSNYIFKNE